jgi:FMN reductase [NAD(P)H]
VAERDEPLDRVLITLEHGLDGPIPTVRDPARNAMLLRETPRGVTEEHALHLTVDDDATPDHAAYSRAMEFKDVLKRRRMVRAYEPKAIPRETLERIVGTIRRAPSAGFSQGQRFVVVRDPEAGKAIAEATGEDFYVDQGFEPWISGAAALILVCTREDDYHDRYRQPDKLVEGEEIEWPVPYWYVDAGKAAMLVLLAAIDEGLAAGVFGIDGEGQNRVRELLGLPEDVALVEVITLGYPGDDTASDRLSSRGTRPRRPIDELVRWERY